MVFLSLKGGYIKTVKLLNLSSVVSNTRKFEKHLASEEYGSATVQKYKRDILKFIRYLNLDNQKTVSKNDVILYKRWLFERYSPQSVNSMLASLNMYMKFLNHPELTVKYIKIQQKPFADPDTYLTKDAYLQLVAAAYRNGDYETGMIMETLCSTGIRIDELKSVTAEGIRKGRITTYSKGKAQVILVPQNMQKKLLDYIETKNVKSGPVFQTKYGNPVDRSNVWKKMKKIASEAGISEECVYPHNFRHVFAETYYEKTNDLISLANLLGHTSIDTTRIYLKRMEQEYKNELDKLDLVMDHV